MGLFLDHPLSCKLSSTQAEVDAAWAQRAEEKGKLDAEWKHGHFERLRWATKRMRQMASHLPKAVRREIVNMLISLDYVDNVRVAKEGDAAQEAAYAKAQAHGCCGFYDTSVKEAGGGYWMVGCNYGH